MLPHLSLLSLLALSLLGCDNKKPEQAQQQGGAMPVQVQPVKVQRVDISTEYIGTIKSRGATMLQPQVEGQITKILVHSGERVRAGQSLMQIDPLKQQATVNTQEATRRAREAQLVLTAKQLERTRSLAQAGVVSKQELDQAESTYEAAKADVDALHASVNEQKEQLRYYNVTSPTEGVVGDVPVRVGDHVATS